MKKELILAVNPGTEYTRLAVYQENTLLFLKKIKHSDEELQAFDSVADQLDYRTKLVIQELKKNEIETQYVKIIVGRGGLIQPVKSGVYEMNKALIDDLTEGVQGQHANNLGGLIAHQLLNLMPDAKAVIADPVVVDEMCEVAKVTGHPLFTRKSVFHALNQKSVARKYAKSQGKKYEEMNLIVAHVESGISIGAHENGKVIDVNQAFDGGGPFSFERTGSLPIGDLLRVAYSGEYTIEELYDKVTREGGIQAYLGVNTLSELEDLVENQDDEHARFIALAMAYQVAKEIGAMATTLMCNIDGIILSGEIFHWKRFSNNVKDRISRIAPVAAYPNENEMEALAMNGLMVLRNEVDILTYY